MIVNGNAADKINLKTDAFVEDRALVMMNENKNSSPVADKVPLSYVCRQCYNCVYRSVKHSGHTR